MRARVFSYEKFHSNRIYCSYTPIGDVPDRI